MAMNDDDIAHVIETASQRIKANGANPLSNEAKTAIASWAQQNAAKIEQLRANRHWDHAQFASRLTQALGSGSVPANQIADRLDGCDCSIG